MNIFKTFSVFLQTRLVWLTKLALIAFAANSVLTRLALAPEPFLIDPTSFATIRVVSAALALWVIVFIRKKNTLQTRPNIAMVLALFVYMVGFSLAYVALGAGIGALILFASVQLTMFAVAQVQGERFTPLGWLGLAAAISGVAYLVSPSAMAPPIIHTAMMIAAGMGWGVYSILGKSASDPLISTAWNFALCTPLILICAVFFASPETITLTGIGLAIASGVLASGLGYVIWYAALADLSAGHAASVQLTVPVIAAIGRALLLVEPITIRMIVAATITLGGVALVLAQRQKQNSPR